MTEKTKIKEEQPKLEELLVDLENIARSLEAENVTLEESFQLYNQGMKLLKQCGDILETIEKDVLMLDENGEMHEF